MITRIEIFLSFAHQTAKFCVKVVQENIWHKNRASIIATVFQLFIYIFCRRHSSTLSESSILSGPSSLDLSATTDPTNREGGKLVPVVVLNTDKSFTRIGTISVSGRSNWDLLDSLVHRLFKEYVMRVDPTSNLGLNAESIGYYQVGEIKRTHMSRKPELLPYGYLVGDATDIMISLKKCDANIDVTQVNKNNCLMFHLG